jgi:hypothetical protein
MTVDQVLQIWGREEGEKLVRDQVKRGWFICPLCGGIAWFAEQHKKICEGRLNSPAVSGTARSIIQSLGG